MITCITTCPQMSTQMHNPIPGSRHAPETCAEKLWCHPEVISDLDWFVLRSSREALLLPDRNPHLITPNHGIRNRNHRTRSTQRRLFPYRERSNPARRRHPRSRDQRRCTGQDVPFGFDWEEYHRAWLMDFLFVIVVVEQLSIWDKLIDRRSGRVHYALQCSHPGVHRVL